jgi:predicted dehydrogenase
VAESHGIPRIYRGYEPLLEDPEIEAVYVPLPNHLHHPWTLRALESGKHVLCEKPLARNASEAEEMSRTAEVSGRALMEAFMYRFHPRSLRVKSLLEDGRIGEPRLLHASFCFRMQEETLEAGREPRLRPGMGGGALLDVGCYGVSVSRWLLGREPAAVQARALYHPGGVDLLFVGTLHFPNDVLATVEAGFVTGLQQTYAIVGTRGAIELPHDAFIPWERDAIFTLRGVEEEEGEEHVTPGEDEYRLMVEHFSDVVRGVAQLACPPAESVANMRVLDALAESARAGHPVSLG